MKTTQTSGFSGKSLGLIVILAWLLFSALGTTSCSSDLDLEQYSNGEMMTFEVEIPTTELHTRAGMKYADGSTVSVLKCYVYNQALGDDALPIRTENITIVEKNGVRGGSMSIDLPASQKFDFVFVATATAQDDKNSKLFYNPADRTFNVNYAKISSNDETMDSFVGVLEGVSLAGGSNYSVTLRRPFAQLNIGSKDLDSYNELSVSPLKSVGMTVDGVYSSMNVMDGTVVGDAKKVTIANAALPSGQTFPVADCKYLAMNYLLVNERKNVEVTMNGANEDATFTTSFQNVPLQRNYQTNIFGKVLTSTSDFTITIDPAFAGSSKKDTDDPYADYDLVLKVNRYSNSDVHLSMTQENGKITYYSLKDYIDSNNYVKISWPEKDNITNISFQVYNSYESAITEVLKCDINMLDITDFSEMFRRCRYLKEIKCLKDWDTSNVTNMYSMFESCYDLQNLDLSTFHTDNVINMQNMFFDCENLRQISLASFNTSKVNNMNQMFTNCRMLESLDLSSFDTSNVSYMAGIFSGCYKLNNLNIISFNTSNVIDMSKMFYGCANLENLDVSRFNTSKVNSMKSMFCDCKSLKSLDISSFDTSNVTDMSNMFAGCERVSEFDLSNFDTSKVSEMTAMFQNCKNLSELDLSSFDTSHVTTMSYMFCNCEEIRNIIGLDIFDTSNVTDMSSMFSGCDYFSTINTSNFDTSNVTDMNSMFSGCKRVSKFDLSNFDTSKVTNMNWMFANCSKCFSFIISNFDTSNVTDMSMMFYNCANLYTFRYPNFNTSKVVTMKRMFRECKKLSAVDVSYFDTSSVKDMSEMFMWCDNLSNIDISNFIINPDCNTSGMFDDSTTVIMPQ